MKRGRRFPTNWQSPSGLPRDHTSVIPSTPRPRTRLLSTKQAQQQQQQASSPALTPRRGGLLVFTPFADVFDSHMSPSLDEQLVFHLAALSPPPPPQHRLQRHLPSSQSSNDEARRRLLTLSSRQRSMKPSRRFWVALPPTLLLRRRQRQRPCRARSSLGLARRLARAPLRRPLPRLWEAVWIALLLSRRWRCYQLAISSRTMAAAVPRLALSLSVLLPPPHGRCPSSRSRRFLRLPLRHLRVRDTQLRTCAASGPPPLVFWARLRLSHLLHEDQSILAHSPHPYRLRILPAPPQEDEEEE